MLCQESNKVLDAYVDNELDLMQSLALEEHLTGCRRCALDVQSRHALSSAIQSADLRAAVPRELVQRVRKSLRMPEEKSRSERWYWFRNVALGFGMATAMFLLAAAVIGFWFHVPEGQKMAQAATDVYIRSMMMENRGIDVVSSDKHTVKPWFNGKISFSPEVTNFEDKGFPLVGGRLDYVANQTVATLVYKRNAHFIDVFLYPESHTAQQGMTQERGYNVLYWFKDGMQYCAVSDLNLPELKQLAGLLQQ
jgi:anti-sigma factor RsiW